MQIFRIRFSTRISRVAYTGLFASSVEAVLQTLADWPDARRISVSCISKKQGAV
jgi:hypothetical protein